MTTFNWTPAAIALLRQRWAEGVAAAAIGREIGVSKNAVVGKAHRLNLPPRPSPIRGALPRPVRVRLQPIPLPPLASVPEPPVVVLAPRMPAARHACCWPLGDPKSPGFRFCGELAVDGRPYCVAHIIRGYQRKAA